MALATPEQQKLLKKLDHLTNMLGRLTEGTDLYWFYKNQHREAKREYIDLYIKLNGNKI